MGAILKGVIHKGKSLFHKFLDFREIEILLECPNCRTVCGAVHKYDHHVPSQKFGYICSTCNYIGPCAGSEIEAQREWNAFALKKGVA